MWILIVLQLASGSATAKNSLPINYSGVVMQEFSSQESCQHAAKTIEVLASQSTETRLGYRNGIISTQCIPK
jgi:hypothetical protein